MGPAGTLVKRALVLSSTERTLLVRAVGWLVVTDLRLRFSSDRSALLEFGESSVPLRLRGWSGAVARARTYARWIRVAARFLPLRARCLHQSLALRDWLRSESAPARLRIGVRLVHSELRAHAWVEIDGQVVNDSVEATQLFYPLPRIGWPGAFGMVQNRAFQLDSLEVARP